MGVWEYRRRFSSAYTHESVTVLKIAACLGMSKPNIFTANQLTREPEPDTGKAAPTERDHDIATRFPCIINNAKVHAHRPRPAYMTCITRFPANRDVLDHDHTNY